MYWLAEIEDTVRIPPEESPAPAMLADIECEYAALEALPASASKIGRASCRERV